MTRNDEHYDWAEGSVQQGSGAAGGSPRAGLPKRGRILRFALTAILVGAVLALTLSPHFYDTGITDVYCSLELFGALIVLVMLRRTWDDLIWVFGGAVLLCALDFWVMGFELAFMAGFSFFGLAGFAVLGIRTIWANAEERRLLLCGLVPLVLFIGTMSTAGPLLALTTKLHPKTFDVFLYSFDCSLGLQISFLVGQLCSKFWQVKEACVLFYFALPLPLALIYAGQLRKVGTRAVVVMTAFLIAGPIGVLFYNMLPACGPICLFGGAFPYHPLPIADVAHIALMPLPVQGIRNAIPSLHMTWVLLIWWNSKGLARWMRGIALSFVCGTVLATLGLGEHYFVDLVVAFPFSLMIQAISSHSLSLREGPRRTALLFGTFTTLAWMAMLSFVTRVFWVSRVIPWAMIVATIWVSVVLWHRLLEVLFSEPLFCESQSEASEQAAAQQLARAQGAS